MENEETDLVHCDRCGELTDSEEIITVIESLCYDCNQESIAEGKAIRETESYLDLYR